MSKTQPVIFHSQDRYKKYFKFWLQGTLMLYASTALGRVVTKGTIMQDNMTYPVHTISDYSVTPVSEFIDKSHAPLSLRAAAYSLFYCLFFNFHSCTCLSDKAQQLLSFSSSIAILFRSFSPLAASCSMFSFLWYDLIWCVKR